MSLPTLKCRLRAKDTVLSDSISRPPIHHQAPDASSCPLEAHPLSKPTPAMIPSTDSYLPLPPRPKLLDYLYHNIIHSHIVGPASSDSPLFSICPKLQHKISTISHMRTTRPSKSVTMLSISPYLTTLSQTLQTYDGRNPDSAYTNVFLRQTSFATSHTATYSQSRNSISNPQLQRRQERKRSLSAVRERCQSYEQCRMLCPTECVIYLPDFVAVLTTNHVLSR